MTQDYKIHPLGKDPRESLSVTDKEIIHRKGLFGRTTVTVPLKEASIVTQAFVGVYGSVRVYEHGTERIRMDKVFSPGDFKAEVEKRQIKQAGLQEKVEQKAKPTMGTEERAALCLKTLDADRVVQDNLSTYYKHWTGYVPYLGDYITSGSRNINVTSQVAGKEVGVYEYRHYYSPASAIGICYVPEDEVYLYRDYKEIVSDAGRLSEGRVNDEIRVTSFDDIAMHTQRRAQSAVYHRNVKAAVVALVGIFAASVVFGGEAPEDSYSHDVQDNPEYILQID